ncbi:MAG TPA: MFS transporter [Chloroflexi bacterium]|nr:MFS transporter [Chloroflexota bacterium]
MQTADEKERSTARRGLSEIEFSRLAVIGLIHRLRSNLRARTVYEHNERVLYGEVIFQALAASGAMSFLSVFLVRLGAPNWLVGLYSSLPALVTIVAVLPVGAYVQSRRDLVATANWGRFIFRASIGAFAFLPLLPATVAPFVLVIVYSIISIPSAAINIAVTTIWGSATTPDRRPRMLSTRMAIHGLFAAGFGLLAGQWLDWAPYPLNYQLLFISAFVAGLASIVTLRRLRLPEQSQDAAPAPEETSRPRTRVRMREIIPLIRSLPAFRNYAVASFVFRMGLSMPSALYTIYRVRTLGASDAWIGVLLTVERLVGVVAYFALARLVTRPRFRQHLWLSCLGMALYPITTALSPTPEALLLPAFLLGLFSAGVNTMLTNTLYQVSPEDQRPTFVAVDSLLANITAFAMPMVGTLLADATNIRLALAVAGSIRIIGGLFFWRLGVGHDQPSAPADTGT